MPNSQHLPSPSAGSNQSPRTSASPDRSKDELSDCINLFNSHDKANKVHCNINETSVDFLDVTIFQGSGFSNHNILYIKVYFKDTDIPESLHKKFFHPKHRFEGILKSLLIRLCVMGFRSNSKCDENLECSGLRYAQPITTKFGTGNVDNDDFNFPIFGD